MLARMTSPFWDVIFSGAFVVFGEGTNVGPKWAYVSTPQHLSTKIWSTTIKIRLLHCAWGISTLGRQHCSSKRRRPWSKAWQKETTGETTPLVCDPFGLFSGLSWNLQQKKHFSISNLYDGNLLCETAMTIIPTDFPTIGIHPLDS